MKILGALSTGPGRGRCRGLVVLGCAAGVIGTPAVTLAAAPAAAAPVAAATTLSVDGVSLSIAGAGLDGGVGSSAAPDATPQVGSADRGGVHLSAEAIAYGRPSAGEAIPAARPGGAAAASARLARYRLDEGARQQTAVAGMLFGQQVVGIRSVGAVPRGGRAAATNLTDWATEYSGRLWIFHLIEPGTPSGQTLVVTAGAQALTPGSAPSPPRRGLSPTSIAGPTLPYPWWWAGGPCNSSVDAGAYELTSWGTFEVCAPGNAATFNTYIGSVGPIPGYQCVELAERWMNLAYGVPGYYANGNQIYGNYAGSALSQIPNNAAGVPGPLPQPGDVISIGPYEQWGHTAVVYSTSVDRSGNGWVSAIEENAASSGLGQYQVSGWQVQSPRIIIGWLTPNTAKVTTFAQPSSSTTSFAVGWTPQAGAVPGTAATIWSQTDRDPWVQWLPTTTASSATFFGRAGHSYGFAGGAVGGGTPVTAQATETVAAAARNPLPFNGLYGVDAFGDLLPGSSPPAAPSYTWPGWRIARGVAMRPDGQSGYVLDGWGGLHPFGGAPAVTVSAYWQGWDIARGVALTPAGDGGWVLDGWGGLHPFGNAPAVPYSLWYGWDIARALSVDASGRGGWVLDGWGGVHPFGDAPAVPCDCYWRGWDIARSIATIPGTNSGYVLDGWGGIHSFGGAPAVTDNAFWYGWDIARAVVALGPGRGGYTVDGWGGIEGFGGAPAVQAPLYFPGQDIVRGAAVAVNPTY